LLDILFVLIGIQYVIYQFILFLKSNNNILQLRVFLILNDQNLFIVTKKLIYID